MILHDAVRGITRSEAGEIRDVRWVSQTLKQIEDRLPFLHGGALIISEDDETYGRLSFDIDESECVELPIMKYLTTEHSLQDTIEAIRTSGTVKLGTTPLNVGNQRATVTWYEIEVTVFESHLEYYQWLARDTVGEQPPFWRDASSFA